MVKVYRKDLDGFYEVSEARATELEQAGYSRTPQQSETVSSAPANDGRTAVQGMNIASNIFGFMPDDVLKAFSAEWVKSGNADIAIGATRQTKAWKDNFGKLMRDDGTLIMDELSFEASDRQGESIIIDENYVANALDELVENEDLSRYIL